MVARYTSSGHKLHVNPTVHPSQYRIVDDHKVDHLRETYKEQLFLLKKIKINFKILRYIEKYDFIKQIN